MKLFRFPPFPSFLAVLGLAWVMTTVAAAGTQAGSQPEAGASPYAGAETCQVCHEELYKSFSESAHQKLLQNQEPARQGCEGCHGAGAEHVNSGGDKSKIFRFSGAQPATIRAKCTACHPISGDEPHRRRGITCLSCHAAHHYRQKKFILTQSEAKLCPSCHS